jgi:transposase
VRVLERCRIVLLAADGVQDKQIAERMSVAPLMASRWRHRFLTQGVAGLVKDAPRPGRTPTITAEQVAEVIAKTTQSTPANTTQWSRSTMARQAGISESSVGRIWRAHGLKPRRVESFKISNDPEFAAKLEDIVSLYLDPPEHALVLSVGEKSQIQALDRTQPGLPMKKGRGQTMTHDYKRNGTTTLFAALKERTGGVRGRKAGGATRRGPSVGARCDQDESCGAIASMNVAAQPTLFAVSNPRPAATSPGLRRTVLPRNSPTTW